MVVSKVCMRRVRVGEEDEVRVEFEREDSLLSVWVEPEKRFQSHVV